MAENNKAFKLSTDEIQYLVIALIYASGSKTVIPESKIDEMIEKLASLNNLCNRENNYTLSVDVKG